MIKHMILNIKVDNRFVEVLVVEYETKNNRNYYWVKCGDEKESVTKYINGKRVVAVGTSKYPGLVEKAINEYEAEISNDKLNLFNTEESSTFTDSDDKVCFCREYEDKDKRDNCNICNGTGIDNRQWYVLVGWSENCSRGYWNYTSDLDEVSQHCEEGMELYGVADSTDGAHKLSDEFYENGGWFYR